MKKIVSIFMVGVMLLAFVGCSAPAATPAPAAPAPAEQPNQPAAEAPAAPVAEPESEEYLIGMSWDAMDSLWTAVQTEMLAYCAENGAKLVELVADGDADLQNTQISQLLAQGCQAIIIFAKDASAIATALKECKNAGVPAIMLNRPLSDTVTDVAPDLEVLCDDYDWAYSEVEWFADIARKEGKTYNCLVLVGALSDVNALKRQAGHTDAIKANSDVLTLVTEVPMEWNVQQSFTGVQNAMAANPEINCIITPGDDQIPGIQSALELYDKWAKIGEENHVAILSFGGLPEGVREIYNGYVECCQAQSSKQGNVALEQAIKMINGEKPESDVIYSESTFYTYENIMDTYKDSWAYQGSPW